MKKKENIWITCMAAILLSFIVDSCRMMDKADKKYGRLEYSKAIPIYEKALAKDSGNTGGWARLADCYKQNNMTLEAETCYARAVQGDPSKSIYKLNYAEMLMSNGKYGEAKKWMDEYVKQEPKDARAEALASGLTHVETFFAGQGNFKVEKLNINTEDAEFCPALYKDGIVFTSSRRDGSGAHGKHAWTGRNYYAIYYSKFMRPDASSSESSPSEGTADFSTLEPPVVFLRGIQTKYNNSSVCFNKSGTEMMMTRNEIESGNASTGEDVILKVKIYSSTFIDGRWTQVTPFQYNSDSYSVAHPALSPDGSTLYFASDMPGTYGGMDLWVCHRIPDQINKWSLPHNLGPAVNTAGNELFPTVADNGTVFFSSNGHEGLGGLDIYSTADSGGTFSKPKNMGAPYNSSDDDFGLVWNSAEGIGYFSSNRTHQGYNDDIYSIRKRVVKINCLVRDKQTNEPLDSTRVSIIETLTHATPPGSEGHQGQTGREGTFTSTLHTIKNYQVIAERENYKPDTLEITETTLKSCGDSLSLVIPLSGHISITGKITNDAIGSAVPEARVTLVNLASNDSMHTITGQDGVYSFTRLEADRRYRIVAATEYGDSKTLDTSTYGIPGNTTVHIDNISLLSLNENIEIKNIYYDLDKYNIRPDAGAELDKLVELMKKYPKMIIELGSHTDCRASRAYNMKLSQRRANAAVAYLEKSGIDRKRMTAKGYGESQPVNKCECEGKYMVACTEEEHQMNRRTAIKILSIN